MAAEAAAPFKNERRETGMFCSFPVKLAGFLRSDPPLAGTAS
jgi:hypothetical protein